MPCGDGSVHCGGDSPASPEPAGPEGPLRRRSRPRPRRLGAAREDSVDFGAISEEFLPARPGRGETLFDGLDDAALEVAVPRSAFPASAHALLPLSKLGGSQKELEESE